MIIDANTHGLHGGYFGPFLKAGGKWAEQQVKEDRERAAPRPEFHDPTLRLKQMDRFGIDYQVVTPGHWIDADRYPGAASTKTAIARALNDNMAKLQEAGKGRMVAVGTISLLGFDKGGRQEMERAIHQLGLHGFTVASNIVGKPLDIFEDFWAAAEEMNTVIYIHPRHPQGYQGRLYEEDFNLASIYGWPYETVLALARLMFSGVIKRHPNLRIVAHHLGGGMIPFFIGRVTDGMDKQAADDILNQLRLIYYDTAIGKNPAAVRCALEVLGTDRMVFATDVPWGANSGNDRLASYPGVIKSLGLSPKVENAIFSENIRRIIQIP